MRTRPFYAEHGKGLLLSTLDELRGIAAKRLIETEGKTGYSYRQGNKRVLKLVNYKDSIFIEITFYIPERAGLLTLSDDDRKRLHAGATKQCYVGSDVKEAKKIIELASNAFNTKIQPNS